MATVKQLAVTLAKATKHPIQDVLHRARRLREDGQLPQEGRGLSAARIEDVHAARLLIAVLLKADKAVEIPDAVQRFGSFVPSENPTEWRKRIGRIVPAGKRVTVKNFLEALVVIMEVARDREQRQNYEFDLETITVHRSPWSPAATIQIRTDDGVTVLYDFRSTPDMLHGKGTRPPAPMTDSNTIPGTILAILSALVADFEDPFTAWPVTGEIGDDE